MAAEKTYDDREALAILGSSADSLRPDREAAQAAANILLAELQALDDKLGYFCRRDVSRDALAFGLPHKGTVLVAYSYESGRIKVLQVDGKHPAIDVPISYERAAAKFVGTESDEFIVPVPGQPRARRSALAVLVEAITTAIGEQAARARE